MAWNCEQIEERLSEYLDGMLGPAERREFEAHAAKCAQCKPLVASVSGIIARVQRLEEVEPPARLVHTILDATLGPRAAKPGWKGMFGWMRLLVQPRFAVGFASVVLTAFALSHAFGFQFNQVKAEDLKPRNLYRSADRKVNLMYARGVKFFNDLRVVNEIQSRLQPEAEPPRPSEAAPTAAPAPKEQKNDEKAPKQQNQADEWKKNLRALATVMSGLPGRSH